MGKKRKLAYDIKKQQEGFYMYSNFEAKPEIISELERNYRITDDIMKFIVIKEEKKYKPVILRKERYKMNKVILMGRLTRDPEVRYTQTNNTL